MDVYIVEKQGSTCEANGRWLCQVPKSCKRKNSSGSTQLQTNTPMVPIDGLEDRGCVPITLYNRRGFKSPANQSKPQTKCCPQSFASGFEPLVLVEGKWETNRYLPNHQSEPPIHGGKGLPSLQQSWTLTGGCWNVLEDSVHAHDCWKQGKGYPHQPKLGGPPSKNKTKVISKQNKPITKKRKST